MGYLSVNTAKIERKYTPKRVLLASVYCDELQKWTEQEFEWHQWELACDWLRRQMYQISM